MKSTAPKLNRAWLHKQVAERMWKRGIEAEVHGLKDDASEYYAEARASARRADVESDNLEAQRNRWRRKQKNK